jgi:Holliday junction DNA helicase RuvA
MIARLKGTLVDRQDGRVVIDCAGVGYEVSVSGYTQSQLGELQSEVCLRIHTQFSFQDGKITLYGFSAEREHRLFDLLIEVKGVSASKAMPILSNADPVTIAGWIAGGKTTELKACRGIGKKTADALVFELQEKCEALLATFGASGEPVTARVPARKKHQSAMLDQVGTALLTMGWKAAEVDTALGKIEVPAAGATLENLLREALQVMPR